MKSFEIPNKLEAANFEDLRLLMLATNVRLHAKVIYDIHPPQAKKGIWIAFYYERVEATEILKERLSKIKGQ